MKKRTHGKNKRRQAINKALQAAQGSTPQAPIVFRTIPTREGHWQRGGNLVRIKLIDLEPALPEDLDPTEIRHWRLFHRSGNQWQEIPVHVDYGDAYGRWVGDRSVTADAQICFMAPSVSTAITTPPPAAATFDCCVPLSLWDSRNRARCNGLFLCGNRRRSSPARTATALTLEPDESGFRVSLNGQTVLHFSKNRAYQLDFAAVPGSEENLIEFGRVWRWLPTETLTELTGDSSDEIGFEPVVTCGMVVAVRVSAKTRAGWMTTTLRIFQNAGALVLEFSDYRAVRTRPELPPEKHTRDYAGQVASPYPGVHYAALVVDAAGKAQVFDHLYKFGPVPADGPLALVYAGEKYHKGYNWMVLKTPAGCAGIAAHGRSHHPDHPFKVGTENGRVTLLLEPFGSVVGDYYHSCDRYMLVLAPDVRTVREVFDTLDTYPILAKVPVRRNLAFLKTYECLARWVNLNLDYLMRPGHYRNALLTNGTFKDDRDTCLVAVGEMIRLYEKTGWPKFLETAAAAADFVADWILAGKLHTRGEGLNPNGGGIYQNEQIYLLLSLARVYRITHTPRLIEAIRFAVRWLYDHREESGWGWDKYPWHAGGFDAAGKALYYWPVNTNEFATLNFRLYELLGETMFYDYALEIMNDYIVRLPANSREVIRGGGVSDTTRGVHLFAEAIAVAGKDPRIDKALWKRIIQETQDRFWIEGWVQIRNSIYGEVIRAGQVPGEIFSPGFTHWHNVGSFLDILPRIQVAAEAGVSRHLTRWAIRDLAYDFDVRYGMEEHTHFGRFTIRDSDIEPASWLDPELCPALRAVRKRGWIDEDDFALLFYKIHRMVQRTFIPLDRDHGGWAGLYDAHGGEPIKHLAFWEHRHSHERFDPGESREMWGIATREAFHDHSTHYWSHLEQLVDELLKAETVSTVHGVQTIRCQVQDAAVVDRKDSGKPDGGPLASAAETNLGNTPSGICPVLIPLARGAKRVKLQTAKGKTAWKIAETRIVRVGGQKFWLLALTSARLRR